MASCNRSVGRFVQAVYLDEIQDTGRTNVPVAARADAIIGKTARIRLRPATDRDVSEDFKFIYAGERLAVWLTDTDLNQDNAQRETVDVTLSGNLLGRSVSVDTDGDFARIRGIRRLLPNTARKVRFSQRHP